ncbi:hypothetical protein FEI13_08800 [Halomonas urmiana]|uniref:Uncharacterized protein n=1 Tax=Halomonas urmiana TaxID=490901 RepID=A0A5R8MI09_9GAMM|nr:hypothetical protein [Halomonas urmiana]TLF50762.1 hypothetical protein FEI13_08800 [Halomonas urmiana]
MRDVSVQGSLVGFFDMIQGLEGTRTAIATLLQDTLHITYYLDGKASPFFALSEGVRAHPALSLRCISTPAPTFSRFR